MLTVNKRLTLKPLILLFGILLLGALAGCSDAGEQELTAEEKEALISRIKPEVTLEDILGKVDDAQKEQQAEPASAAQSTPPSDSAMPATDMKAAMELYNGACMACHSTGVAGAPKVGDKAAWAARAETGLDTLVSVAIAGKGVMPPKGGSNYSEDQMRQVIEYMLAESGIDL